MERRRYAGRHLMVWGSLFLLAWAAYEFVVRGEVIWWAVRGLYNLCQVEGVPFARALTYFDPSMFWIMAFLLVCIALCLLVIGLRNKPLMGYLIIPLSAGVCAYGGAWLHLIQFSLSNWLQALKFVPVLLIIAGSVVNLCQYYARRARVNKRSAGRGRASRLRERELAEQVRRRRHYEAGM